MKNKILRLTSPVLMGGRVVFLLRDDFNDTRAAGSINGTPATPGPGTRTVIDTGNRISVGSGNLIITQGASAWGDPEIKYMDVQITRTFGRMLLVRLTTHSSLTGAAGIGFDSNGTGQPIQGAVQFNAAVASFQAGGTCPGVIGPLSTSTTYDFAIILKATGCYGFIKGGTLTNWTLLWYGGTSNAAALYVLAGSYSNTLTAGFLRVPNNLFIVPILAYDTFTRADGAIGNSEATGPDGQGCSARAWTGATWTISSNKAVNTPTKGSELITNGNFTAWTGDNPDSWTLQNTEDANNYVTEVAGAARVVSDGVKLMGVYQTVLTVGSWHRSTLNITARVSGTTSLTGYLVSGTWTSTGNKVVTGRATSTNLSHRQNSGGTCDWTIDDSSTKLLTLSSLFSSLSLSTANVIASVDLTFDATSQVQAGLVVCLDSAATPANFIIVYANRADNKIYIDKCVAGTYTNVASTAYTYSAGAKLIVVKDGTSVTVYYNNAIVGSTSTISDAGIVSNTIHGLFTTGEATEVQLDNFALYARGNEGQYSILDRYTRNG